MIARRPAVSQADAGRLPVRRSPAGQRPRDRTAAASAALRRSSFFAGPPLTISFSSAGRSGGGVVPIAFRHAASDSSGSVAGSASPMIAPHPSSKRRRFAASVMPIKRVARLQPQVGRRDDQLRPLPGMHSWSFDAARAQAASPSSIPRDRLAHRRACLQRRCRSQSTSAHPAAQRAPRHSICHSRGTTIGRSLNSIVSVKSTRTPAGSPAGRTRP